VNPSLAPDIPKISTNFGSAITSCGVDEEKAFYREDFNNN
jgi:hypothetical protein